VPAVQDAARDSLQERGLSHRLLPGLPLRGAQRCDFGVQNKHFIVHEPLSQLQDGVHILAALLASQVLLVTTVAEWC
jgi:hypothetical protein